MYTWFLSVIVFVDVTIYLVDKIMVKAGLRKLIKNLPNDAKIIVLFDPIQGIKKIINSKHLLYWLMIELKDDIKQSP